MFEMVSRFFWAWVISWVGSCVELGGERFSVFIVPLVFMMLAACKSCSIPDLFILLSILKSRGISHFFHKKNW